MQTSTIIKISYLAVTLLAILLCFVSPTLGFLVSILPLGLAISLFFFKSPGTAILAIIATIFIFGPGTATLAAYQGFQNFKQESPEQMEFATTAFDIANEAISQGDTSRFELAVQYIEVGLTAIEKNDTESFNAALKELKAIQNMGKETPVIEEQETIIIEE